MSGTTSTFGYTGAVVDYTVPSTGLYDITAYGAQGGTSLGTSGGYITYFSGGPGAIASVDVTLTQGETLTIIVGGKGGSYTPGLTGSGGGGGGSFVLAPGDAPLAVAGGGGGGGTYAAGGPGLFVSSGAGGSPFPPMPGYGTNGMGGRDGNGGQGGTAAGYGPPASAAGGGGGLLTNGTDAQLGDAYYAALGKGGQAAVNGGAGGLGDEYGGSGGFGGGGGAGGTAGGGGGGYSGAGGSADNFAGGGGGSYVAPFAQHGSIIQGGNYGDGLVTLTDLSASPTDATGSLSGTQNSSSSPGINDLSKLVNLTLQSLGLHGGSNAPTLSASMSLANHSMINPETVSAANILSFLTGFGSAVGAIAKLKQFRDNPQQIPGLPIPHSVAAAEDLNPYSLAALGNLASAISTVADRIGTAAASNNFQAQMLSETHSSVGIALPKAHQL